MAARFLTSLGEMLKRHGIELRISAEENRIGGDETCTSGGVGCGGDVEFEALLQDCADLTGERDVSGWEDLFASFSSYPAMVDFAF